MTSQRNIICRIRLLKAVQALLGEFLLIGAVLILLAQSFAAQAAPTLDVICGEQGAVVIAVDGQDDHNPCPECTGCDDCLANSARQTLLIPSNDLGHDLPAVTHIHQVFDLGLKRTALYHAQMLRGPPAKRSETYMHSNAKAHRCHMGVFS